MSLQVIQLACTTICMVILMAGSTIKAGPSDHLYQRQANPTAYLPIPKEIGSLIHNEGNDGWTVIPIRELSTEIAGSVKYRILDMNDRVVKVGTIDSWQVDSLRIQTSALPQGMYLLELHIDKMTCHRWLFK